MCLIISLHDMASEAEFLYHQILMKNMSEFSEETINPYESKMFTTVSEEICFV
jgi:hypothetical protein